MLTYAIKRILLMILTFFAISLLIFVLLNLGAGDPGAQQFSGDGNQNAEKVIQLLAILGSGLLYAPEHECAELCRRHTLCRRITVRGKT